uniref:uncharacterized protein LOC129522079 n=1 Tax=Nyctereutes procyonoides TaxID=34880 RepID=UPI0024442C44|nr:uncharacterized protein LOC129522079 [Nyctereutes procyonoides]
MAQVTPVQSDLSWNRECTGTCDSSEEATDPCRCIREVFLEEITFWLRRLKKVLEDGTWSDVFTFVTQDQDLCWAGDALENEPTLAGPSQRCSRRPQGRGEEQAGVQTPPHPSPAPSAAFLAPGKALPSSCPRHPPLEVGRDSGGRGPFLHRLRASKDSCDPLKTGERQHEQKAESWQHLIKGHQLGTRRAEDDLSVRADRKLRMSQCFREQAPWKPGGLGCQCDWQTPSREPSDP